MKYHVGCGKRYIPGWIHVDGANYQYIENKDISLKWVASNSAEIIYASHLLEYFDSGECILLIREWYRVLKKGGILRLSVPDLKKLFEVYQTNESVSDIIGPLFGKMEMAGETVYHKIVFDMKTLQSLLSYCGFSELREWDWRKTEHCKIDDHSRAHWPHDPEAIKTGKFGPHHIQISLNIEAIK